MNTILKNCLIWGTAEPVSVWVEDEKIRAVAPELTCEGAEEIDMSGKTVLPGFFNAHVHLYGVHGPLPDELIRRFVSGGVTTVRDMGMTSPRDFREYMDWLAQRSGAEYPMVINSGKFLCGENTYGDIHPSGVQIGYRIDMTPEGAARAVDEMISAGAQTIKTGLDYGMDKEHPLSYLPDDVFAAICRRARERGLPSSAHITKPDNFVKAAGMGLTESAHVPTEELSDEDAAAAAETGMTFTATASIFDMVSAESGEQIMDAVLTNIGKLRRAGMSLAVGTDFMFENPPYQTAGIPVHELRLLSKAGLSVDEIIRCATEESAKHCGIWELTGSIEAGKLANIIAVSGKIDETFSALETVDFVMTRGIIIKNNGSEV